LLILIRNAFKSIVGASAWQVGQLLLHLFLFVAHD
jgi:hypothetical protein